MTELANKVGANDAGPAEPARRGQQEAASSPPRRDRAVLLAASTLTIMAAAVLAPSLPGLQDDLADGSSAVTVGLALTITSAAIAVTAPLTGLLLRKVGARATLVAGLIGYAAAGTAGLWVWSLPALLVSRVVLGVAVGLIMTTISSTISMGWTGTARTQIMAGQQVFASLGGVVFLPLSGLLATLDWRWPTIIYAASLPLLPLALSARLTPHTPAAETTSLGRAEMSPRLPLLRIIAILLVALTATAAFFMAPTQLPFLLQGAGLSTPAIGVAVAASTATGVLGALSFPTIRAHLRPSAISGLGLAALGLGWLIIGLSGTAQPAGVFVGALTGGIGVGVIVPNLNMWLSELSSASARTAVLGSLVTAIFGGQFISPVLAAPVISAWGVPGAFTAAAAGLLFLAITVTATGRLAGRGGSSRT